MAHVKWCYYVAISFCHMINMAVAWHFRVSMAVWNDSFMALCSYGNSFPGPNYPHEMALTPSLSSTV